MRPDRTVSRRRAAVVDPTVQDRMREVAEGAASRAQIARDRLTWVEAQRRRLAGGDPDTPGGDGSDEVEEGILESVE